MAYTWAKVYIEILDDHKMGLLPDSLWRRVIELILLAKKNDKDGFLPGMIEMAWILRMSPEQLEADLGKLSEINVTEIRDGQWYLTNFAKRQDAEPVVERVRNFRKRNEKQDCNDDVTQSYQTKTKTRLDKTQTVGADAPKPPRKQRSPKSDERTATAAIQACYATAKRFPPIELYDKLIGALGNAPEIEKLAECRAQWLARGYNPNAWTWAIEWYVLGIPSRNGNGNHGSPSAPSKLQQAIALSARHDAERAARNGK